MDAGFYQYVFDDIEGLSEPMTIDQELEKFRKQWKEEIVEQRQGSENDESQSDGKIEEPSIEEQARYLFLQGVAAEQRHQLAEAIRYYRKAVQLVPDIEFRIDEFRPQREPIERTVSECSVESEGVAEEDDEEDEEDVSDLMQHFQRLRVTEGPICQKHYERPGAAFASLPAEVLNYILKWLVSADLDVASLENVTKVCRGFYVASRDEELWRLICQKIWGLNCGGVSAYGSYRNMYYQRPHLRFNGCYISKTVYFRQGESSIDSIYRPFHMVEYYRYVRFYPEGHVLMTTCAESPQETVPKLKHKNCNMQGLLYGWYRIVGNVVSLVMKRRKFDYNQNIYGRYRRKARREEPEQTEETFHVEFDLEKAGSRPHAKLQWRHYSCHLKRKSSGEEQVTDFDLSQNTHPPLVFSRVKSYTQSSDRPLK